VLIIVLLAGYWQIGLMQHPPKYDLIDQMYPWRYYIGECLQNSALPLWNPYEILGYPIHADPQSGAWYPFVWIIGYVYGYDIYSLSWEFFVHIILAGVGMFLLGITLRFDKNIALIMAVSYCFSGFFVGNAQHLPWIISGTWIPFVINFFIKFSKTESNSDAVKTGFFLFMMVSGGYPGLNFIFFYFLGSLFLLFFIKKMRASADQRIGIFMKLNVACGLTTLGLCSVLLISISSVWPFISRSDAVPLEQALLFPLSPQCLISFILPYAVITDMPFFGTDLAMSNIYMGLIPFIFFLFSLFIKKSAEMKFFFWWGLGALTVSVGSFLPVREFLYHVVPLMDLVRYPSQFRFFTIFCFIILAGYAMDLYIIRSKASPWVIFITLVLIFGLVLTFLISLFEARATISHFCMNELFHYSQKSYLWEHVSIQSLFQIFVLIAFLPILTRTLTKRKMWPYILLIVIDLVVATQLNAPFTVYYEQFRSKDLKQHSQQFPSGFPPPLHRPVGEVTDKGSAYGPLWKNLNIFHKQIAGDGYNPFHLKQYDHLATSFPQLFTETLSNPPVYLSAFVYDVMILDEHIQKNQLNPQNLYLKTADFIKIKNMKMSTQPQDAARISFLSPHKIVVHVKSSQTQILTLLQNYCAGWQVQVNNKPFPLMISNISFMSTLVPPGQSTVVFTYQPRFITAGLTLSLMTMVGVCCLIMTTFIRRKCGGDTK